MTHIAFIVPGEPRGKGRPRFVRTTGHAFTPERTRRYENMVEMCAVAAMNGREPFTGPVTVRLTARFPIPGSWSKKKNARAVAGLHKPTRIDIDQICKAALDGMNGVVFKDDRQVWGLTAEKVYTSSTTGLDVIVDESASEP